MKNTKAILKKRRKIIWVLLLLIAIVALIINQFYTIPKSTLIPESWHMKMVYFLLCYKIIELSIFYLLFYKRHYLKVLEEDFHIDIVKTFEKNAKRFFFLVPQGSIVFGIIAYKLSMDVRYLLLFLTIAAVTLLLVNPERLQED